MRHRARHETAGSGAQNHGSDPDSDSLLDSLESPHSVRIRVGVGAAVILLIAAMAIAVVVSAVASQGDSTEVGSLPSSPPPTAPGRDPTAGPSTGGNVLVHVLGAVKVPGLVSLGSGARVVDAVAAAGGLSDDAEQPGINLARLVTDGEQLVVPRVGEVIQPAPTENGNGSGSNPGGLGVGDALVDLNSATQEQLETLQGIGPALASRILDWREANGRFSSVADLMNVSGIGQKVFDGLKDRITV